MIGLNRLQIVLVSIIILLTSGIIQEYQEEWMQQLNDIIPQLLSGQKTTSSNEDSNNPIEQEQRISRLLSAYETILTSNARSDTKAKQSKNSHLAFGYVADLDIYVDGVELMKHLGFSSFVTPRFHDRLTSIDQISETFALFFENGAGTELYVEDAAVFEYVFTIAKQISKKQSLGGNAATMAVRAFKEGAKVVLGHAINDEFYESIFARNATRISLEEENNNNNAESNQEKDSNYSNREIKDVHLVLDFYKDSPWGQKTTPRSNRMYLNHDTENSRLAYMGKLHKYIKDTSNAATSSKSEDSRIEIMALSGFQLLNHRDINENTILMQQLGRELVEMKARTGIKTHLEMGTFTDRHLFHQLAKNALLNVDSIGLNEQELSNLIEYLERNHVIEAAASEMEFNDVISDVLKLLSFAHQYAFKLNRVHFHTINMQMICAQTSEWGSSEYALAKAIMVALQESENTDGMFFAFDPLKLKINIPDTIRLPQLNVAYKISSEDVKEVTFNPADPISCWNPHKTLNCCVAPAIQVVHPQKTCGLGDNISATGLVYHPILRANLTESAHTEPTT